MGSAKHAFNIEPGYEFGRYGAHMGMSYNSSNIDAYQYYPTAANGQVQLQSCNNNPNPNPTPSARTTGPSTDPAATITSIRISRWTRR